MSTVHEEEAIRFLRGEENPFDAFVVPDRPGIRVQEAHVPAVHQEEYNQLRRVLDKYRNPDYPAHGQAHDTRLVIVRGVRGSGKTHLLHILMERETETPEVWVRPRYYDSAFAFSEYVLTELVRTLLAADSLDPLARLESCATAVSRQLLYEAVATLTAETWPEWLRLAATEKSVPRITPRRWQANRDALLEQLLRDDQADPLPEICCEHGLPVSVAWPLMADQIQQCLAGSGVAVRIRREVLLALADLALRGNADRCASLLEHDYRVDESALPPARAEVVLTLLEAIPELLSAARIPIVFAFDNVERLLAPRGTIDFAAAQSFFSGLAHLMDQTRGMLVLLFVETGLWNQLGAAIDNFAEHRLRQGVRIRDYGCIWNLELKPPSAEQIGQVMQQRMQPLLARAPGGEHLRAGFPFGSEEARDLSGQGIDVLRTALLRLRDRYDELVLPREQQSPPFALAGGERAAPPMAGTLKSDWEAAAAEGRKRLQALRRTALSHELHAGLARWLETLIGQEVRGWRLSSVAAAIPYGDHPTFGLVTIAHWQDAAGRICRTAIGPVLGEGRGMPKDLEIKLAVLRERPALADQLVVLWPVVQGAHTVDQLPPATQQVWDQGAAGRDAFLCRLPIAEFAWLISFPEWLATHLDAAHPDALKSFVQQQTGHFLEDYAPRLTTEATS